MKKKLLFFILIMSLTLIISCAGNKSNIKVVNSVFNEKPSWAKSNKSFFVKDNYLYFVGIGEHKNINNSIDIAKSEAMVNFIDKIKITVRTELSIARTDNENTINRVLAYFSDNIKATGITMTERYVEEITKNYETKYRTYALVSISKKDLYKTIKNSFKKIKSKTKVEKLIDNIKRKLGL